MQVGQTLTLTLPWPPAQLSPNARHAHWATLARLKRRYRSVCGLMAMAAGASRIGAPERLAVSMTFCPPDRRARDMDNCIAAMKAGLDGLADATGIDDSRWSLRIERGEPVRGGAVVVTMESE